jgi:conjugal transfer/entry exclusion protein
VLPSASFDEIEERAMRAVVIERGEYGRTADLLDQMFRLRARVFDRRLGWDVAVEEGREVDEAWPMLGHPVFRDKIREWLKVLRKANCAVVLSTQSISDAEQSGIVDVSKESRPTKICQPDGTARGPGTREFYERLGFNERQTEIVARAVPKRQYYVVSPVGRRLFDMRLGPLTLAFVGASGKSDLAKRITYVMFGATVVAFCSLQPGTQAGRGGLTGGATEWTRLLNDGELVSLVGQTTTRIDNQIRQTTQLAEQIQNQLRIHLTMLRNTAQLAAHVWSDITGDLARLQSVVTKARGLSFSMGNADDVLTARFKSYADFKRGFPSGQRLLSTHRDWSTTNRDLAQARRESLLDATAPSTHGGQTMEPRWRGEGAHEPIRRLLALMLVAVVLSSEAALAQDGSAVTTLENQVVTAARGRQTTMMEAARSLFWILAGGRLQRRSRGGSCPVGEGQVRRLRGQCARHRLRLRHGGDCLLVGRGDLRRRHGRAVRQGRRPSPRHDGASHRRVSFPRRVGGVAPRQGLCDRSGRGGEGRGGEGRGGRSRSPSPSITPTTRSWRGSRPRPSTSPAPNARPQASPSSPVSVNRGDRGEG